MQMYVLFATRFYVGFLFLYLYLENVAFAFWKSPKSERITSMTEKVVNRIEVGTGESVLQRVYLVRGDLP
jgi:hypothetical protein